MDMAIVASAAGIALVGSEVAISTLCTIGKIMTVNDNLMTCLLYLGKTGLCKVIGTADKAAKVAPQPTKADEKNQLEKSLSSRAGYHRLEAVNLGAQIQFIAAILQDRQQLVCKEHGQQMQSQPFALTIVNDYKPISTTASTPTCQSPICRCKTLSTALDNLGTLLKQIITNFQGLEKEHERYHKSWFSFFLHDEEYFDAIESLIPLLKECKNDLLTSVPYCNLIINSCTYK